MGLWQRLTGRTGRGRKMTSLDLFREIFGFSPVKSGVTVNWQTAIQVAAVFACARVIAEGVAQLPLKVYRERPDGGKDVAKDHALYRLLHRRPNDWQTSFEFRETLTLHAVLTGSAFAIKNVVRGDVRELLPLQPNWVTVKRLESWELVYEIRPTASDGVAPIQPMTLRRDQVLHLRGPSWDAVRGLDAVRLAREAIGLAIATEEHHARMHANGVRPTGVYSVEGNLTPEQYQKLRDWIEKFHAGVENSGRPMILDRNAKWISQAMTGVDAQHLETRKFQIEEICRAMRVFPQMVMHSDKTSTFASAEAFFNAHLTHSLGPWLERWTQTLERDLLTDRDLEDGITTEFVVEGLLHADVKAKADFLSRMTERGIMTRNEARAKLNLNPLPGLDEPLTPANMTVGAEPEAQDAKDQPTTEGDNDE